MLPLSFIISTAPRPPKLVLCQVQRNQCTSVILTWNHAAELEKSLVLCGYNSRQYKNSSAAAHRLWFPFFLSSCPPLASFNIDQIHIYLCLSSCINIFLWPYTHSPVFEFYFLNLFSLWSWLDWLDLVVMHLAVLRLNNVFVSFIRAWWSSYRTFPRCTGATRKWAYCWLKPTGWSLPSLMRPTTTRDDKQGAGRGGGSLCSSFTSPKVVYWTQRPLFPHRKELPFLNLLFPYWPVGLSATKRFLNQPMTARMCGVAF